MYLAAVNTVYALYQNTTQQDFVFPVDMRSCITWTCCKCQQCSMFAACHMRRAAAATAEPPRQQQHRMGVKKSDVPRFLNRLVSTVQNRIIATTTTIA
jgi:hypothetical protein